MTICKLKLMVAGAALGALAGACSSPTRVAAAGGTKPIEARAYALKSGAVIYLPDSILAVNRKTDEVLLQKGYVRLESKGQEKPATIKLKTYGTLVESRGSSEVLAVPGQEIKASCLRGSATLKFPGGQHEPRTLKPGQVATIELKKSRTPST